MDLNDLRLLLDVATQGSFAAAAKGRNVDASSVSRAIAALEARIGVRLFQRTTRSMELTEAGAHYLARVVPLLEELERAEAEVRGLSAAPRGTLRLTASVTFGQTRIVPLLPAFRAEHPGVRVEGLFTDANVDLVAERIDLAVRLAPRIEGDVIATKLMDTHYRVVASPAYLVDAAPLKRPSDLTRHRCLLFNLRGFQSRWVFRDRHGAVDPVDIDGDYVLAPAGSLRDAAVTGLGPALLADWLVDGDIAAGRLIDVFPRHNVTATTFDTAAWLVYPSRSYLPAKVRAMIDFLKDHVSPEPTIKMSRRQQVRRGCVRRS